ncbi:hypothetical protein IE81DRAFT_331136, partial [Ceraceosorus guamensis]
GSQPVALYNYVDGRTGFHMPTQYVARLPLPHTPLVESVAAPYGYVPGNSLVPSASALSATAPALGTGYDATPHSAIWPAAIPCCTVAPTTNSSLLAAWPPAAPVRASGLVQSYGDTPLPDGDDAVTSSATDQEGTEDLIVEVSSDEEDGSAVGDGEHVDVLPAVGTTEPPSTCGPTLEPVHLWCHLKDHPVVCTLWSTTSLEDINATGTQPSSFLDAQCKLQSCHGQICAPCPSLLLTAHLGDFGRALRKLLAQEEASQGMLKVLKLAIMHFNDLKRETDFKEPEVMRACEDGTFVSPPVGLSDYLCEPGYASSPSSADSEEDDTAKDHDTAEEDGEVEGDEDYIEGSDQFTGIPAPKDRSALKRQCAAPVVEQEDEAGSVFNLLDVPPASSPVHCAVKRLRFALPLESETRASFDPAASSSSSFASQSGHLLTGVAAFSPVPTRRPSPTSAPGALSSRSSATVPGSASRPSGAPVGPAYWAQVEIRGAKTIAKGAKVALAPQQPKTFISPSFVESANMRRLLGSQMAKPFVKLPISFSSWRPSSTGNVQRTSKLARAAQYDSNTFEASPPLVASEACATAHGFAFVLGADFVQYNKLAVAVDSSGALRVTNLQGDMVLFKALHG